MKLLTPTTRISAGLAATTADLARHLASAAVLTDRLAADLLARDDDSLAAWLNAQSPQDVQALFGAHAIVGEALNGAATVITGVLAESGVPVQIPPVDTRPVADKLATQRRTLTHNGTAWLVTTEPEPEQPDLGEQSTEF
jgi:hypothetical protein